MCLLSSDLTPIEEHDGVLFKRDDLFMPFVDLEYPFSLVNGGKVRQCIKLIESNLEHIKKDCDSTVGTAVSVGSPQGLIVSLVAKYFSLKTIIGIGATTREKAIEKNPTMRYCDVLGAEIQKVSGVAYNSALYAGMKKLNRPMFNVSFGMQSEQGLEQIINAVADQVENIPNDVTLVVPVGSGITFASILVGVRRFSKKLKNILAIQPFGYDRTKTINSIAPFMDYTYSVGHFPYHTALETSIAQGFDLDSNYEAKAWATLKNIMPAGDICFWCVGNANHIRK